MSNFVLTVFPRHFYFILLSIKSQIIVILHVIGIYQVPTIFRVKNRYKMVQKCLPSRRLQFN